MKSRTEGLSGVRMDKVGENLEIYQSIQKKTISIFLIAVQIYLLAISMNWDYVTWFVDVLDVKNQLGQLTVRIFFQLISLSVIYTAIYKIIYHITSYRWKKSHKQIWVKGRWLHIHVKNDIRVGLVDIKQNFYSIKAKGGNISPQISGMPKKEDTIWEYYMGRVFDDSTCRDFIGCYSARKNESQKENDGMHILTISSGSGGKILRGRFGDTFKVSDSGIQGETAKDHSGQLFLVRMSDKCSKYLTGNDGTFSTELLKTLHKNPEFSNEPYVKELKKIIKNREKKTADIK